jgi:hypothetical protein
MRPVAIRLALAALAVVGAVVAIHALRADHRCAQVKDDALHAAAAELPSLARSATDRCGTPADRAALILAFITRRRPDLAVTVARRTTESSPDDYSGWLALGRLTGNRRALARAHELNPLSVPSPH